MWVSLKSPDHTQGSFLVSDSRNRTSVDSIVAELQIRRNPSMSCIGMHKHLLFQKELKEAISSNDKHIFKK